MSVAASGMPLAGVGVLITRPSRQSAKFAQRIAVLGAEPFILPSLVIAPPSDPALFDEMLGRLMEFDFAFFVSANAAEAVVTRNPDWPDTLTALAVGPSTADALFSGGIDRVAVPAERYDSEGVLAMPALQNVAGKRIVIFRGESERGDGRDMMRASLAERGAIVEAVYCYRRMGPTVDPAGVVDAWRAGRIDAAIATSNELLDNFLDLIGDDGRALLGNTPLFVPHPRIAAHARARGLAKVVVTDATDAGMIAGLLNHFSSDRQPS